jgi:SAM-dependent methyltransferase
MGFWREFVTPLHKSTKRDYLARMNDDKVHCMLKAKEYGADYWDGDRRYGYGGYNYRAGYWTPVAQSLIDTYNLKPGSKILDLGCGKGFLLHELLLLEPELQVVGTDISVHGLSHTTDLVKPHVQIHDARGEFKWQDKEFDLVISLTLLHNLRAFDLENCLREIQRIGKSHYVTSESYRTELEQFNLQCWALTCETFFDLDEWLWMFEKTGYTGDYEFIYFE